LKTFPLTRVKTHRILTWQGKSVVLVVLLALAYLLWPLFRIGITHYICRSDELRPAQRIIVENWDGQIDLFEESARVAASAGAREIYSIIFDDAFRDPRKKRAYILNAWAAGIDTAHFSLIAAIKEDPKTLHIAQAVLDTAYHRHWQEVTVITADLHSARTRKAYIVAARLYHIAVRVIGVPYDGVSASNWMQSSTGLAMAFSETIKRIYYDLFIF
jgi:hypothetical protein